MFRLKNVYKNGEVNEVENNLSFTITGKNQQINASCPLSG